MKNVTTFVRIHGVRRLASTLSILTLAFIAVQPGLAREKWPAPTEEAKRQAEESKRHEEEVWKRIEPELAAWTKKGKPYFPGATLPADLPQAGIPAFPGAEGAGRLSFGGRGGKVFVVTNLADNGPGTFREACESAGPRIVVFNTAGIVHLTMPLHIIAPYITIAGNTAPGDGVCIAGRSTLVDTHDVVIRHMRFRRGETNVFDRDDALGGNPIGNIIVDHCSASWGLDENFSMYRHMYDPKNGGAELKLPTLNITIQWCISSEALDPYNHAFGATWGGRNSSFHHNLFANNTGRNPSIGMSYDFNFVNNVLFNWRHRTMDGGDRTSLVNCINNYYKPGPMTPDTAIRHRLGLPQPSTMRPDMTPRYGQWHVAGNVVEGNAAVTANNWAGGVQFKAGGSAEDPKLAVNEAASALIETVRAEKAFPMSPVAIQTAKEAYESVLVNSGATLPHRDPVDLRIIEEVRTGKVSYEAGKGIITDIKQIGGYPEYKGAPIPDLGADGIPLSWKKRFNLDANDAALHAKDLQGDGYTVIEKYLYGLDPTKKFAAGDAAKSSAKKGKAAPALSPEQAEAAYVQAIEKRTDDILAALSLSDAAKTARVRGVITNQYRALRDWQAANENVSGHKDEAARKQLHARFVSDLARDLTETQLGTVKDKLTYGKVQVTFDAYCEIVPNLTAAHKAQMLALLKEAREEAMDGVNADEKSAVFKKYKGRINNYLSAQGFDVAKAYKDFGAKQQAKSAPKPE
ncbi:MAG: DUF3826 domain-containing protein [Verrucomicrobia bacterium]|nr:DUF3826 domain-containing protein [Verrucomicrobiota bacterium]